MKRINKEILNLENKIHYLYRNDKNSEETGFVYDGIISLLRAVERNAKIDFRGK